MTRRTRNHATGDRAQTRVRQRFEDAGFVVNDLPRDYGEDLLVRIFQGEQATPYAFFVQSKGSSRFRRDGTTRSKPRGDARRARVSARHLRLWRQFAIPVLVTYWDERLNTIYWEFVPPPTYTWPTPTSKAGTGALSIRIPTSQVLNKAGINQIRVAVVERHDMLSRMALCIDALIRLINKNSAIKIVECDPQSMGFVCRDKKTYSFCFFGHLAQMLRLSAEWDNLSLQKSLEQTILNGVVRARTMDLTVPADRTAAEINRALQAKLRRRENHR